MGPSEPRPQASADTPPPRDETPVTRTEPGELAPPDLVQLEAEERYHRERLALYRARAYGARPTSPARLRELGRIWTAAKARLTDARSRRR